MVRAAVRAGARALAAVVDPLQLVQQQGVEKGGREAAAHKGPPYSGGA
jgi:hypothetical protein